MSERAVVGGVRSRASLAMDRYADGDTAAFAILYDELAPRLLGYLRRLTKRTPVAEDLLQQTFLQMHSARGRFLRGAAVEPWAYAVARRLFLGWHRRAWREVPSEDHLEIAGSASDAESDLIVKQLAEALEHELDALSPKVREAFILVRTEGLSVVEAAEVLGTTVAAVKLRAHRGGIALRELAAQELAGKGPK